MATRDLDKERKQILAVLDQEKAAIEAGDIGRYLEVLADDAVFMPPNLPAMKGDELRQWLSDFLQRVTIRYLNYVPVETVIANGFAFHVFACSWQAVPKAGGEPKTLHFKGLHILRRQRGGSWKIAREIWNTSPDAS
jgi:ketosteroid isomerase-like protein